jgi:CubicO group peptidase (beta-lactamase class C family)
MLNRRHSIWGAAACAAAGLSGAAMASGEEGTWSGVFELGSLRLRVRLEIDSKGSATFLSIDQSNEPRPGQVRAGPDGGIEIEFASIHARYVGRLVTPDRIDGIFHQGSVDQPLVFERGDAHLGALPAPHPIDAALLAELRREAGAPGMAAAARRKGSPTRFWFDGERVIGSGVTVQQNDLWHIGSITKSMTSTLVARLVERGAVHWDDTVGDVLSAVAPDMNEAYRKATFRHLLSHHAGLQPNVAMPEFVKFSREISDAREERKAYARLALLQTPKGPMEMTYEYSNNGYVIAGAMLEARLGAPWESLIRTHLFEVLGLASAGFGAPGHAAAIDQPVGHARSGPGGTLHAFRPGDPVTDNPVVLGPAGRVHLGLADLIRYLEAHRDEPAYLRPDSWRMLHTPPFSGAYAMGWSVRKDGTLSHSGSNTLWYAEVQVDPNTGVVAAAAANDGELTRVTPPVGKALLAAAAAA